MTMTQASAGNHSVPSNGQRFSALPNLLQNARRRRPISLTRLTAAPEDLDPPGQPA